MISGLVSVIIPAYNASKYIVETVESVLNQTYPNIELILVNDGSTDETAEILKPIIQNNSQIQYYEKPNSGVCDTRNEGYNYSKGEFVIFLDADDLLHSQMIESCLTKMKNDTSINVIFVKGQVIDENSNKTNRYIETNTITKQSDILMWREGYSVMPSPTIIKRIVLEDVGLWDSSFSTAADQDLFIRISTKYSIVGLKEVLFYYRIHSNNMHQNIALMEKDHIGVFNKAKKNQLFESASFKRKCFGNLHFILAGSWWVNGKSKLNGIKHLLLALVYDPLLISRVIKKIV